MKEEYSQEHIDEMRKRLYQRGANFNTATRHELTDTKIDVSRSWAGQEPSKPAEAPSSPKNSDIQDTPEPVQKPEKPEESTEAVVEKKPRRLYRTIILLGSVIIFILITLASSAYLFLGGNQISTDNIQVAISGPESLRGGEELALQVGVSNNNSVPIESATLIVKYPPGTRSLGDSPRNLYEERIPLDVIVPGDTKTAPVRVAIFGEENSQKEVSARLEYRIGGSNGTFDKESEPFTFTISSSLLTIDVDPIETVASGQLVDVTVHVSSNTDAPLQGMLLTAQYPNGFDYESASQEPVYGENVWRIDELLPEAEKSITITGIVRGQTEESLQIQFSAGPADPENQNSLSAALADQSAEFTLEEPFIDVAVNIEDQMSGVAILDQGEVADVEIDITNTLDETLYDMVVEVVSGGNALDEDSIQGKNGFYDSNTNSVRWEVATNPDFSAVNPGGTRTLGFTVTPGRVDTTSAFDLVINVYASRVAQSEETEQLVGSVSREGKYSSSVSLGSQVGRNVGRFGDAGPIPPEVGETTTYTVTVVAEAGANDMNNAVVETSLPVHVNWLDEYDAQGAVEYNSVSKQLEWSVGDITTGQRKELSFQVSILPSTSQVRETPVLLNRQTLRANDGFTGQLLQDTASPVTTELSTEAGFAEGNGRVER